MGGKRNIRCGKNRTSKSGFLFQGLEPLQISIEPNIRSWSKRMRMYNHFVQGNAEIISIASDDSIWDSDSENEDDDDDSADRGSGEKDEVDGE